MSRGRPEERTSLPITPQKDELEFVIAPVVESVGVLVVAVVAVAAAAAALVVVVVVVVVVIW